MKMGKDRYADGVLFSLFVRSWFVVERGEGDVIAMQDGGMRYVHGGRCEMTCSWGCLTAASACACCFSFLSPLAGQIL